MNIGYARVSTFEQSLDLQLDALRAAGCTKIFEDRISGSKSERPGWSQVKAALREGDSVVVWKLDRLGRSLKDLINVLTELEEGKVGFRSLSEGLDTTTSSGRLLFHVMGSLAEFERSLIVERTKAGLVAARARGRKGGRPRKLDAKKVATARRLLSDPEHTVTQVAEILGVGRATLYRALERASSTAAAE